MSHTSTMNPAPKRPSQVPRSRSCDARARHSAMTSAGTIFTASAIANGSRTISSTKPSTGMKSGMRSIGLSA